MNTQTGAFTVKLLLCTSVALAGGCNGEGAGTGTETAGSTGTPGVATGVGTEASRADTADTAGPGGATDAGGATDGGGSTGDSGAADSTETTEGPPPSDDTGEFSSEHPNMFVDGSEIQAIKEKVLAGEEPWSSAYDVAISRADSALNQPLLSVRDGGTNLNANYDGDASEGRHDYNAAGDMSHAVRDLGIGYAFSGNEAYAQKAIAIIYHWTTDPSSSMNPNFTSSQAWIELTITMPAMYYGADLVWEYPGWEPSDRVAFVEWVAEFAAIAQNSQTGVPTNNFGDWRLVFLASSAVIAEDSALMSYAVAHYKNLVPTQITSTGRFGWEEDREEPKNGLFYSTFAMIAIAQVCEIVRHHGTDLYNWQADNGTGSIEKGFDNMAPFVANPATWPQQGGTYVYQAENSAGFELAYLNWQKAAYAEIIEPAQPMNGNYVQGPLTLTHSFGAY